MQTSMSRLASHTGVTPPGPACWATTHMVTTWPTRLISSESPRWYAEPPAHRALMFKAGGADGDPEVLQVRHQTAFAQHADALLTADVLALDGIDHLHLTGITLGISPVVRAARSPCSRRPSPLE